jgi:1,4-dihydroxy-2-naphthoate octaprenyltransferase
MRSAPLSLEPPAWRALKVARLPLYARFVRVYIVDPPLAALVGIVAGFGAVSPTLPRILSVLLLLALGVVLFYIVHALDDITGVKTGTDVRSAPRKAELGEPKLLASGLLSMDEARGIVFVLTLVAGVLALPVLALAPPKAILAIVLATLITGQYSSGARWSYHGLGEATVLLNFACCVIVPYVFLTGELSLQITLLGLLTGLSIVMVTFSSNFLDFEADAATGRKSLMVLFGVGPTKLLFAAVSGCFWLLYVTFWLRHLVPPATAAIAVLLPLHILAVRHFWHDRAQAARRLCFISNRLHASLLVLALLIENLKF